MAGRGFRLEGGGFRVEAEGLCGVTEAFCGWSPYGLVAELAFFEIDRARGPRRGVRIMRDHNDRLAVFAVQRLEQVQDLVAGLAVEVTGGLVAEQQGRIGDNRARDAYALLLPAGKLAREMSRALHQPDDCQRGRDMSFPLRLGQVCEQQW